MPSSVQELLDLLVRSRLFSSTDAQAACHRWLHEHRDTAFEAQPFLKWLVVRRELTEEQAKLVLQQLRRREKNAEAIKSDPNASSKTRRPLPTSKPAPAAEPSTDEFDVELVVVTDLPKSSSTDPWYMPHRRDFIMMGIGATAVAAAASIGLLLARVFRLRPVSESGAPRSNETKGNAE
jgi:hypothetical protein